MIRPHPPASLSLRAIHDPHIGGAGPEAPQKKYFRCVLAALPPKHTENTGISAGCIPPNPVDGRKTRFRPHPDAIKVWVMISLPGEGVGSLTGRFFRVGAGPRACPGRPDAGNAIQGNPLVVAPTNPIGRGGVSSEDDPVWFKNHPFSNSLLDKVQRRA